VPHSFLLTPLGAREASMCHISSTLGAREASMRRVLSSFNTCPTPLVGAAASLLHRVVHPVTPVGHVYTAVYQTLSLYCQFLTTVLSYY